MSERRSINVSLDTWKILMKLKIDLEMKTIEDVIRFLIEKGEKKWVKK